MKEIKVGIPVYLKPTGNIARYNKDLKEGVITKKGRKYFYVNDEKFDLETLKNVNSDCNSAWVLYFSKQDYFDEQEKKQLLVKFRKLFDWSGSGENLTLEQLKEMARIVELN